MISVYFLRFSLLFFAQLISWSWEIWNAVFVSNSLNWSNFCSLFFLSVLTQCIFFNVVRKETWNHICIISSYQQRLVFNVMKKTISSHFVNNSFSVCILRYHFYHNLTFFWYTNLFRLGFGIPTAFIR